MFHIVVLLSLAILADTVTSQKTNGTVSDIVRVQGCNKTAQCSNTCGKITYCEGGNIVNDGVNCPASHPYCVQDIVGDFCSDKVELASSGCKNEWNQTNFFCTSEGYFPDPKNCSRYIICAESKDGTLTPKPYSCPSNRHKFNVRSTRDCYHFRSGIPANQCPTIKCESVNEFARAFPGQSQFYYFCTFNPLNGQLEPILFKCENGQIFNGKSCSVDCRQQRNIAIPGNLTAFYACTDNSAYTVQKCPRGYIFSGRHGYCVVV